jgi:FkbM family methyltransferase
VSVDVDLSPVIRCPESMREHIALVLSGEYDVPGLEFEKPPCVLDIGANVGAFATWAAHRWGAKSFIQCFEPNPEAFALLQKNVGPYGIVTHPVAVRSGAGTAFLHFGRNNIGEASLYRGNEQVDDGVIVDCIAARDMPDCDILKIDTESCEVEILHGYFHASRRLSTKAILLEFHSEEDRKRIENFLALHDFSLVRGTIHSADRGTLAYVRRA